MAQPEARGIRETVMACGWAHPSRDVTVSDAITDDEDHHDSEWMPLAMPVIMAQFEDSPWHPPNFRESHRDSTLRLQPVPGPESRSNENDALSAK
jgi:hypothetical protein